MSNHSSGFKWLVSLAMFVLVCLIGFVIAVYTPSPLAAGEQAIIDSEIVVLTCGYNSEGEARASTQYPKKAYDVPGSVTFKKTCGGSAGKLVTAKNNTNIALRIRFGFIKPQDENLGVGEEKTFTVKHITWAGIRIRCYKS
jgi:hypothetical protein